MKKAALLLMIPMFALCSCAGLKFKKSNHSNEETYAMMEEALKDVPIEVETIENITPLELLDNIEQETTESLVKFKKGDADQHIYVIDTNYTENNSPYMESGDYNPSYKDVSLVDQDDNEINIKIVKAENGKAECLIPVSTFEENHAYHVKLTNDKVKFLGKDESIRQITYYSLEVNESNRKHLMTRDNNIKTFDIKKVIYFDVDAYGAYFIYDQYFDIDPYTEDETGMKFRLSDPDINEDNKDTMYGKLVSVNKNPNGAGYIVRYEPCKGNDLFTTLDINDSITVNEDNCSNMIFYNDEGSIEENLGRAFLSHPDVVIAMEGLMNHYDIKPEKYKSSVIDWASRLQLKFGAGFDSNTSTFNWNVVATLNLSPKENVAITLHLKYDQTIRYDVTASLSIETWFFIPTGINYTLEVKEDDSKVVEFGISISTNLAPYDEKKVEEAIENDLIDAFTKNTDVKSKFLGDPSTSTPDGKSYPLFRFDCYYFFPLDIRFEIDFYWQLQLTFEAVVKYTSHTQRVDVSVSNSKGCDPHSETKSVNDKSVTLQFMGSFHAELGLKVSLGVGIIGFYKFFHAEIYIAAYGAVDAQGFLLMGIAWGEGRDASLTGMAGGKFEVSCGVKWGVDIELLFGGFAKTWPIVKCVLIGFAHDSAINKFMETESTIEITDQDYGHLIDLDAYHVLGVVCFDANNFSAAFLDMKHDDAANTRYGAWLDEKKEKYFSFELTKGSEYVTLDDYKLNIKDIYGIEEFDAEIKVTVNQKFVALTDYDAPIIKTIKIHFTNNLKQEIYVIENGEDVSIGSYVIGVEAKLPIPNTPRYQKFVGWKQVGTDLFIPYDEDDPNAGKYIPNETGSTRFEYVFEDYYTWTVVWVDGFGNIIKTEQVFYNESANEPTAEERDQYMISYDPDCYYEFTGWDTDFTHINGNTVIRAMYEYKRK